MNIIRSKKIRILQPRLQHPLMAIGDLRDSDPNSNFSLLIHIPNNSALARTSGGIILGFTKTGSDL